MTMIKRDLKSFTLNSGQEPGLPWTVMQVVPCTSVPSLRKHNWKQFYNPSNGLSRTVPTTEMVLFFNWSAQSVFFLRSGSPCRCTFFLVKTKHTLYTCRTPIKSHSIGCEQEQNTKLRGHLPPHTHLQFLILPPTDLTQLRVSALTTSKGSRGVVHTYGHLPNSEVRWVAVGDRWKELYDGTTTLTISPL